MYVKVLIRLSEEKRCTCGVRIAYALQDLVLRVVQLRPFAMGRISSLITSKRLLGEHFVGTSMTQVLRGAAWLCGEFPEHVENVGGVIDALIDDRLSGASGSVGYVVLTSVVKLLSYVKSLVDRGSAVAGDAAATTESNGKDGQDGRILMSKRALAR